MAAKALRIDLVGRDLRALFSLRHLKKGEPDMVPPKRLLLLAHFFFFLAAKGCFAELEAMNHAGESFVCRKRIVANRWGVMHLAELHIRVGSAAVN